MLRRLNFWQTSQTVISTLSRRPWPSASVTMTGHFHEGFCCTVTISSSREVAVRMKKSPLYRSRGATEPSLNCSHALIKASWEDTHKQQHAHRERERERENIDLLCGRGGQDGSVASWAKLEAHGEARHQLDPQLCDGHLVIHHCDGLLCQNGV
ncbi:hypothetical protein EYF80_020771 [Liparis tanakae]|uniref:Uncharacterized protein n=1 Tax=Liparis tanakae TaxID=230148 RepID=A0A4Z2HTI2_9TELE|nr:hypothetical protein EYF80_020771 [Liparis tanakae]